VCFHTPLLLAMPNGFLPLSILRESSSLSPRDSPLRSFILQWRRCLVVCLTTTHGSTTCIQCHPHTPPETPICLRKVQRHSRKHNGKPLLPRWTMRCGMHLNRNTVSPLFLYLSSQSAVSIISFQLFWGRRFYRARNGGPGAVVSAGPSLPNSPKAV
jgi:hypothetical protein